MKKFLSSNVLFELGQENFQSSITSASVNHIQVQIQSKFKCDDLGIKYQSFTIEIESKCDDLVNQVSTYQ